MSLGCKKRNKKSQDEKQLPLLLLLLRINLKIIIMLLTNGKRVLEAAPERPGGQGSAARPRLLAARSPHGQAGPAASRPRSPRRVKLRRGRVARLGGTGELRVRVPPPDAGRGRTGTIK